MINFQSRKRQLRQSSTGRNAFSQKNLRSFSSTSPPSLMPYLKINPCSFFKKGMTPCHGVIPWPYGIYLSNNISAHKGSAPARAHSPQPTARARARARVVFYFLPQGPTTKKKGPSTKKVMKFRPQRFFESFVWNKYWMTISPPLRIKFME